MGWLDVEWVRVVSRKVWCGFGWRVVFGGRISSVPSVGEKVEKETASSSVCDTSVPIDAFGSSFGGPYSRLATEINGWEW